MILTRIAISADVQAVSNARLLRNKKQKAELEELDLEASF